jgi:EAL domain-containing protein (putative c-di-GMP-specific phosphodiesterase class I)
VIAPAALATPNDPAAAQGSCGDHVRAAFASGAITMVYQPIVDLASNATVGYEALARFGLQPSQPPNVWFDAADRAGLRLELELHTLRLALAGLPALPESAFLSINASPSTITSPELARALEHMPLNRIVLEMTEQEPIDNHQRLAAAIQSQRAAGLRLAIDDVGAGFANLMPIVRLSPDLLKLDRTLTTELANSRGVRALVVALTGLAIELGSTTLAEGIETEQQRALLTSLGVSLGQGYLLGRPVPLPAAGMSAEGQGRSM